jgi:hypothetical protein
MTPNLIRLLIALLRLLAALAAGSDDPSGGF